MPQVLRVSWASAATFWPAALFGLCFWYLKSSLFPGAIAYVLVTFVSAIVVWRFRSEAAIIGFAATTALFSANGVALLAINVVIPGVWIFSIPCFVITLFLPICCTYAAKEMGVTEPRLLLVLAAMPLGVGSVVGLATKVYLLVRPFARRPQLRHRTSLHPAQ